MKHWTHLLMKTGMSLEKENMIWNMTGSFFYAFASMVLSFLVLRIAGEEQGGIFSFGFSTVGQQMFLLAYFGIRPFHITDGTNQYRFGDYLHHRYGDLRPGAASRSRISGVYRLFLAEGADHFPADRLQGDRRFC